jgi:hypothetical protein
MCIRVAQLCDVTAALVVWGDEKSQIARLSARIPMNKKRGPRENERFLRAAFVVLFIGMPAIRLFSRARIEK